MFFKGLILNILLFLIISLNIQASPEQRIKDFYLSNFKEDGTRDWEVKGEEAVIYDKHVDIDEMEANYYSKDGTVVITSERAKMDKENMDVYLEDNVQIENKEGLKLSTDYLKWQRAKNHIETDKRVRVSKDTTEIKAEGLSADTEFKKADFQKDVELTFSDEENDDVTTITCSGSLEVEYNMGKAVFNNDVVVTNQEGKLFSDKATLFIDTKERKIVKIISEGNVKIIRDGNVIFSEKATYLGKEQKIILEGRPRLLYFPKEKETVDLP